MNNFQSKKVIAAIIQKNKKVLIAQRGKKDHLYGKWEFPGGKLEPNETEEECLKRELFEEFEIIAEVGPYFCSSYFTIEGFHIEMRAYFVYSFTGRFQLHEHLQIKWVEKKDLSLFEFPEPDLLIIQRLLEENF